MEVMSFPNLLLSQPFHLSSHSVAQVKTLGSSSSFLSSLHLVHLMHEQASLFRPPKCTSNLFISISIATILDDYLLFFVKSQITSITCLKPSSGSPYNFF
jgi:hypothetical protein